MCLNCSMQKNKKSHFSTSITAHTVQILNCFLFNYYKTVCSASQKTVRFRLLTFSWKKKFSKEGPSTSIGTFSKSIWNIHSKFCSLSPVSCFIFTAIHDFVCHYHSTHSQSIDWELFFSYASISFDWLSLKTFPNFPVFSSKHQMHYSQPWDLLC